MTCIHGKEVGALCRRCEALTWTYTLTDQELGDAQARAFAYQMAASKRGATHREHHDGRTIPQDDFKVGLRNNLVGAIGEWGAAGALDLPRPDPDASGPLGSHDLDPDIDVKASASRRWLEEHGLTVSAEHRGGDRPHPWRYVLAGVRFPRTVVCLGWAAAEDFTPATRCPGTDRFVLSWRALRPMRDLHRSLLDSGHARLPF